MKKLIPIFLLSLLGACSAVSTIAPLEHKTYIIWYDAQIGKEPLLKAIEEKQGTILYDYRNFNAVAANMPIYKHPNDIPNFLQNVPGVLSLQEDQKMQLH
jgi:hypothetical protein